MATNQRVASTFILTSGIGFLFHLIWEYLQCSPLFIHLKVTPTAWAMICATLGDIGILWVSYLAVALLKRDMFWPWAAEIPMAWVLFAVFSASIAEGIEYFAVNRQLWTYSSINPTFRGVSVVPLLQMAVLNPLTILTAKKLLILRESTTQ